MNKTNLPNNLYELRRSAGLSQEDFAERLGVSRQAVSKWERGEAYPDTDNLISISEMFEVTIDELLNSESIDPKFNHDPDEKETKNYTDNSSDNGYFHVNVGDKVRVNLNGGITVNDEDGTVKVDLNDEGITVNSDDGVKVKLGRCGIVIHDDDDDDDDDDDESRSDWKYSVLYTVPYSIICTAAFLILGFTLRAWDWAWTLFMTIPIYDSILDTIRKKRLTSFAYPVFTAFLYCLFGMLFNWWHPGWIIFVTIPVYYPIAEAIDRYTKSKVS